MLTKKEMQILKKSITLIGKPSSVLAGGDVVIPVDVVFSLLEEFLEEEKKFSGRSYEDMEG